MKKTKVLLCVDPGKYNFAYSILDTRGNLLDYMLMSSTFEDLTRGEAVMAARNKILAMIHNIHEKWPSDKYSFALIYERFIPRSMQRGNLGEIVNMCIGGLLFSFPQSNNTRMTVVPLNAATWKNYVKKKAWAIENPTIPIHVLDSIMMGYYWMHKKEMLSSSAIVRNIKAINKKKYGWTFTKGIWVAPQQRESSRRRK